MPLLRLALPWPAKDQATKSQVLEHPKGSQAEALIVNAVDVVDVEAAGRRGKTAHHHLPLLPRLLAERTSQRVLTIPVLPSGGVLHKDSCSDV